MEQTQTIQVSQLRVGIYIHLDLPWLEHPFSFNNFKIRSEEQIETLRELGLKQVRYDPRKSDAKPLPPPSANPAAAAPAPTASSTPNPISEAQRQAKLARIERLRHHRSTVARVEQAFMNVADTLRDINQNLFARPKETLDQAGQLIATMVNSFLADPEVTLHVMSEKVGGEDVYYHSLNVTVLCLMLAREMKLDPAQSKILGLGALMHDIGLIEIPDKILLKTDPLTKAEREFRQLHCEYGYNIAKKAGVIPPVLAIIAHHHEYMDGSGYPKGLKGDAIDPLSRIVCLVNHYDNLCNPVNMANALTPHEALSLMFAQQRSKFDLAILQRFIHCLGVYPPGSIIKLSNEALAVVMALNPDKPLRPVVVVYDPEIPKEEAIILDLELEPDINIARAIRPSQLPRAIYDDLSPRKRVTIYFDTNDSPSGRKT